MPGEPWIWNLFIHNRGENQKIRRVLHMRKILLTFKKALRSTFLVVGLMMFISLSGSLIFVQQPSFATTLEELKLIPPEYKPNSDEKINRANEYDPGVGVASFVLFHPLLEVR
jgi:hypothetical protein